MLRKKISIEMVLLFAEFLKTTMQFRVLADSCEGKQGSLDCTCCQAHKELRKQYDKQIALGSKLASRKSNNPVLSAAWWCENGFNFDLSYEITP